MWRKSLLMKKTLKNGLRMQPFVAKACRYLKPGPVFLKANNSDLEINKWWKFKLLTMGIGSGDRQNLKSFCEKQFLKTEFLPASLSLLSPLIWVDLSSGSTRKRMSLPWSMPCLWFKTLIPLDCHRNYLGESLSGEVKEALRDTVEQARWEETSHTF